MASHAHKLHTLPILVSGRVVCVCVYDPFPFFSHFNFITLGGLPCAPALGTKAGSCLGTAPFLSGLWRIQKLGHHNGALHVKSYVAVLCQIQTLKAA